MKSCIIPQYIYHQILSSYRSQVKVTIIRINFNDRKYIVQLSYRPFETSYRNRYKTDFLAKKLQIFLIRFRQRYSNIIEVLITINVNVKINCEMLIISQKVYTRLLYLSWGIGLCLLITIVLLFGRRKSDKINGSISNILGRS